MHHFIESQQLSRELISKIFAIADKLDGKIDNSLKGKIMASLFYEPSTRTRFSFESAMLRLEGSVITTENAKEFSNIAFQSVALASIVFTRRTKHVRNFLHSLVGAFIDATRVRVVNKSRLEYLIQNGKSGVMKHSISNDRFMYTSDLRIVNPESFVWPMPVGFILQIAIQIKNILFNIQLKSGNIQLIPFIGLKYFQSSEDGLRRNYRPV